MIKNGHVDHDTLHPSAPLSSKYENYRVTHNAWTLNNWNMNN